jgi:hypothetical protein
LQHLSHLKLREFRICTNNFGNRQSRMPLTVPTTSVRTSSFASAAARAALTSFSGRKPSSPTPFSAELANQPRCRVTERSSSQIPKVQSNLTSGRTERRTGFGQRRHQSQAKRLALTKRNPADRSSVAERENEASGKFGVNRHTLTRPRPIDAKTSSLTQ